MSLEILFSLSLSYSFSPRVSFSKMGILPSPSKSCLFSRLLCSLLSFTFIFPHIPLSLSKFAFIFSSMLISSNSTFSYSLLRLFYPFLSLVFFLSHSCRLFFPHSSFTSCSTFFPIPFLFFSLLFTVD